jgi:hypothetical protein
MTNQQLPSNQQPKTSLEQQQQKREEIQKRKFKIYHQQNVKISGDQRDQRKIKILRPSSD